MASSQTTTLTLELRRDATDKLALRAAAAGQNVSEFVSHLVEHFADPPTPIETLSGDIYQRFLESGMTDEELGDELDRAKHKMRAERRTRNAS
jgi:hypothetical protein